MKDNSKANVSHTDEFDKMYKEIVKQVEDKYNVKSEYPETKKGILIHKFEDCSDNEPFDVPTMTTAFDVFHHNGENEWMLYTENGIQESIYYKRDGWFEMPILSADTIVQKVIAEGGYSE